MKKYLLIFRLEQGVDKYTVCVIATYCANCGNSPQTQSRATNQEKTFHDTLQCTVQSLWAMHAHDREVVMGRCDQELFMIMIISLSKLDGENSQNYDFSDQSVTFVLISIRMNIRIYS